MAYALRDYPLEVVHYTTGELRLVHRIDVNMIDAVRKKVDDLLGRIRDARAEHRSRIVAKPVDDRAKAWRKMRSRKLAYPRNLPPVRDRHDAGNNWNRYAGVAQAREVVEEDIVVEEHLRRKEVETRLDLLLHVRDIVREMRAFRMPFGIARASKAESLAGKCRHEVARVRKSGIARKHRLWCEVAAQAEDVLDAGGAECGDLARDRLARRGDACEMCEDRNAACLLDMLGDRARVGAGGAAGRAVRHRHERWARRRDFCDELLGSLKRPVLLRRKHLEGNGRLWLCKYA